MVNVDRKGSNQRFIQKKMESFFKGWLISERFFTCRKFEWRIVYLPNESALLRSVLGQSFWRKEMAWNKLTFIMYLFGNQMECFNFWVVLNRRNKELTLFFVAWFICGVCGWDLWLTIYLFSLADQKIDLGPEIWPPAYVSQQSLVLLSSIG